MMIAKKQLICNVAIYLRLSKDDGDTEESESISNQRAIILEYLNENFNYNKYYEYVDDGFSGATFNRPGFKKMIADLKTKEIDLVITKNLARFARNYIEAGRYIEKLFPDNNIRYIAILDGVDNFEDKIANEFAPIKGVFNELFCKETSKSIKKSKRKKMTEGIYSCNVAPFGYKKDLDDAGKLIIDKFASKIVKRIFILKLNGKTSMQIADLLNKEKIITPADYLKIRGLENRTKHIWTRSMITRILTNPVYTGKCLRGKTQKINYKGKRRINIRRDEQIITENTHKPIISCEIYEQIHNNNKYGKAKKEYEGINTKFAVYMFCGKCKKKIAKRKSRNFVNIHCPSRNETNFLCSNNKLYKYEELEQLIINSIKQEFNIYFRNTNLNCSLIQKYSKIKENEIDSKLKECNKEQGIIKSKISKLYNDRLLENISEENYKKTYEELTRSRKDLSEKIEILNSEKKNIHNESKNLLKIKEIKNIFKNLNKDFLTNEDIGELIEKIYLYDNYIHILYKFKKISCDF